MPRIAVVQMPPVLLDRNCSLDRAVSAVDEAVSNGARLVVFPEAFIPGYPVWVWRLRPGADMALADTLHHLLLRNAVTLNGPDLERLCEAAKRHEVTVVCGINERDHEFGRSTLYNTAVVIGPNGDILNRHRKLVPTDPERMVWGWGDAAGLKGVDTPSGRIGVLICWENFMPLARYALYAQGVEIYIAPTYDSGDGWIGTLQHIAREGCSWVVGCGTALRASDIPDSFPEKSRLYPDPDEWVNPGDSVVVAPGGDIAAGPMREEQGILYADIALEQVGTAHRRLDVAGHYARPDIFQLRIRRDPARPVVFEEG